MLEFYKTFEDGTRRIAEPEPGCWINAVAPTEEERNFLIEQIGILPEFVKCSLDEEESSHIDYDDDFRQVLIIFDYPSAENEDDDSVYDIIAEMESFLEVLSEKTLERKSKELLAFTTILKYKGLEDNNIILVIPASKIKSSWDNFLFEIYVGMTRAIMNLDIIILKSN